MTERISWNEYFSEIALLASKRSPCERLHVGCVLVRDNLLVSTGYNGFLPKHEHKSFIRDNHEQATVHAEINAICNAAKRGVSIDGCVAYITHYPCLHCAKALSASGIKKIYYLNNYHNDELVEKIVKIPIEKLVIIID